MHFYVKITERTCTDPQEARSMAKIRQKSLEWLQIQYSQKRFSYIFRDANSEVTHIFLNASNHVELHNLIDPDPLISYSKVEIEPLLTTVEMVKCLQGYLKENSSAFSEIPVVTNKDFDEISFPVKEIETHGTYFLARKTVLPFNPLLTLDEQNCIHFNTLLAQKAHFDPREIADYNPVGKPVGLLIMKAQDINEVQAHVKECEVYVDSSVEYFELLTLEQASQKNLSIVESFNVGSFRNH